MPNALADNPRWSKYAPLGYDYWTDLPANSEADFRQWVSDNNVPFNPEQQQPDYDMRGFYLSTLAGDGKASSGIDPYDNNLHFSDYFKTPVHRTYSNESQGAQKGAPRWVENGKYLIDSSGNILFDSTKGR